MSYHCEKCGGVNRSQSPPASADRLPRRATDDTADEAIAKAAPWLQQCGSCDAGLTMNCTCPGDDPRAVIASLCDRLTALQFERDALLDRAVHYRRRAVVAGARRANIETLCDEADAMFGHLIRSIDIRKVLAGDSDE